MMEILGIKTDKNLTLKEHVSSLCSNADWKFFVSAKMPLKTFSEVPLGLLEGLSVTYFKVSTPKSYVKLTFMLVGCVIPTVTNLMY